MKSFAKFCILIILFFAYTSSLSADEGEIILGEYEPVIELDRAKTEAKDQNKPVRYVEVTKAKSYADESIDQLISEFERELSKEIRLEIKRIVKEKLNQILVRKDAPKSAARTLDQEIDEELLRLFGQFRTELRTELRKEMRKKIVMLLLKYGYQYSDGVQPSLSVSQGVANQSNAVQKPKTNTKQTSKSQRTDTKKTAHKPKPKKRLTKTVINTILIGKDKTNGKTVVGGGKSAPVIVTVVSPYRRKGVLKIFVTNLEDKKSYPVYEMNPFRLNFSWGQDQFIWDGTYTEADKKLALPAGNYQLYAVLTFTHPKTKKKKTLTRYWGYGKKAYFVTVEK